MNTRLFNVTNFWLLMVAVMLFPPSTFAWQEISSDEGNASEYQNVPSIQLLVVEENTFGPRPGVREELVGALSDALVAVRASKGGPRSRESALVALNAIQRSLRARGYAQPMREKDWPNTMGQALKEVSLQEASFQHQPFISAEGAVDSRYYVDCDMAAQLFLSVAILMSWDFRIVNVPKHTFIRWRIDSGEEVSWDWTWEGSESEDFYVDRYEVGKDSIEKGAYLRSLTVDEAMAYYQGLMGSYAKDKSKAQLLLDAAIVVLPLDPLTQNNYVWHYVSGHRDNAPDPQRILDVALSSLSARPHDCNVVDTVSCAYANAGRGADGIDLLKQRKCSVKYQQTIVNILNKGNCHEE